MINIVLFQPEIPPNTGNIIRTCKATQAKLHIIKPIAFDLDPKYLKRSAAGWILEDIEHEVYETYDDFLKKHSEKSIYYLTRYGKINYSDVNFKKYQNNDDLFVMFGTESTGIPKKILKNNLENCLRIPMDKDMRSLNLANTVFLIAYEIQRQWNFEKLSKYEVQKGQDFLLND
ncbi:tRNA (cytidine(34)-2'-O)-methyltransferase [[Mycoplasma] mobile]|uniref:Putative tRNA (cytidine(34)-2'-O)-methyltransferase n=1 Tax=Mycoplasma mobile (strain ATCC 43663 / 163K / NCTC 11711) TaxID=267748 RepID=Q6KIG9_MYCM1|nr:tRNA (cytidine(34)-2'-O)-methyltransferase [[Mycoplasma] mobile]AAT27607.1 spoU class tRNA/rRNA methylase [Mycoplasma mobile 163K]